MDYAYVSERYVDMLGIVTGSNICSLGFVTDVEQNEIILSLP